VPTAEKQSVGDQLSSPSPIKEGTAVQTNIKRLVPRPVKRLLHSAASLFRSRVVSYKARAQLSALEREYKKKYGSSFTIATDDKDEMLPSGSGAEKYLAKVRYLQSAELLLLNMESVLRDVGRSLRQVNSYLEFACGYGKLIRFLVHRLGREKITASDISRDAVDFVRATFGVQGFYSAAHPDELNHAGKYDVINVFSLFSHLPLSTWGPWLKRLYAMLNDDGLLLFSTLGMYWYNRLTEEGAVCGYKKEGFRQLADGFYYSEENETRGRLGGDIYGIAIVTEDFVRAVVASQSLGELVRVYPIGLRGLDPAQYQDYYVIKKAPVPGSGPKPPRDLSHQPLLGVGSSGL
jgi:2-polyprenyl-3-methyl-5-hydroxy-6-metoxy-1,4-benzoquinol methylase